jgi:exonuclease SbcC
MRPVRLELQGFTVFTEHTEVNFDDAGYFALVGPTGSGKSSLIDAICFALYGSVPRYDHKGLVHPVISQGRLEARVRLDFAIGADRFTAVRVVRRADSGAKVKEARLEHAGEVLAGNVTELNAEVERIIGLSFEQFTTCVVLPQGDFARFLHDDPRDRQELLVKLLNLGIYDHMRELARARESGHKANIAALEGRLSVLAGMTPDALDDARARMDALEKLRAKVTEAGSQIEELSSAVAEATARAGEARGWADRLASMKFPAAVSELGRSVVEAQEEVKAARRAMADAASDVAAATEARDELPDQGELKVAIAAHDRAAALDYKISAARKDLKRLEANDAVAESTLQKARTRLNGAEQHMREAESRHAAIHLAAGLTDGDRCPVCLQTVLSAPQHDIPVDLDSAERRLVSAREELIASELARNEAARAVERASAALGQMEVAMAEISESLVGHRDRAEVQEMLVRIDAAETALKAARVAELQTRDRLDAASAKLERAHSQEDDARHEFELVRDALIPLSPPPAARKILADDWRALLEWAPAKANDLTEQAASIESVAQNDRARLHALEAELGSSCEACGITYEAGHLSESVAVAVAEARAEVERIKSAIAEAGELSREVEDAERALGIAHALATHLSANGFEKWLVNAGLDRLVVGASQILMELSGQQYSLQTDAGGNFVVLDHDNANARRSARTLSGGETFLASLALALALSDQLSDLASEGAARLEAIFLDEGFGTLDSETLDTVAATIENLAASGRIVGVVTHVRELAERIPVQLRVRKGLRTSTVERIDA